VYGYDDGSPAIELTEGFPVGASGAARVVAVASDE